MGNRLPADLLKRLEENRRLVEKPGVGWWWEEGVGFVGLNGFWVLIGGSFFLTLVMFWLGWNEGVSGLVFGWLY